MSQTPDIPNPDMFPQAGLNELPRYVGKLYASSKPAAVLMVSCLDGNRALTVLYIAKTMVFSLIANWPSSSNSEMAARRIGAEAGGNVEVTESGSTRMLKLTISSSAETPKPSFAQKWLQHITKTSVASSPEATTLSLARKLLQEVYSVTTEEGLKYRFDEWGF